MTQKESLGENNIQLPAHIVLILFVFLYCLSMPSPSRPDQISDTLITGRIFAADGGHLAGLIMFEKGRLYGKNYKYGGLVDETGRFSVKVEEGGDYGVHVYATGYIYFPLGIEVKSGIENQFNFTLPPNAALKEAPVISNVTFTPEKDNPGRVMIRLRVDDPNNNLSHQVLGINVKTQEGFLFSPPKFVFPWKRDFPNGIYSLSYDTRGRNFDPGEWYFVAADNRCYNSSVLKHPFTAEGVVPAQVSSRKIAATKIDSMVMDSSGDEELLKTGREVFANNCAMCHHPDSKETKVGPGLMRLFKERLTPARKVPVTEENIRRQIQKGSGIMPPFGHIDDAQLTALIHYLKSL